MARARRRWRGSWVSFEPPDVGTVMQQRGSRIGYLPQLPVLDESLSALGAALQGLETWQAARREYDEISRTLAGASTAPALGGTAPLRLKDESDRPALLERQAALGAEIDRMGGWDQEHRASSILQRLNLLGRECQGGHAERRGTAPSGACRAPGFRARRAHPG